MFIVNLNFVNPIVNLNFGLPFKFKRTLTLSKLSKKNFFESFYKVSIFSEKNVFMIFFLDSEIEDEHFLSFFLINKLDKNI